MKKLVASIFIMMAFASFSATTSWDERTGDWFKWNVKEVPTGTSYVLLFAESSEFDSPIWLNQGTYDSQLSTNGGHIGGSNGGTKQDLDGWWVNGDTVLYVECLTMDAEVWKWTSSGYGPSGWYYQPYKSKADLETYVVARSDKFTVNYLVANGNIGSDTDPTRYFDFSSSLRPTPEPTSGLLLIMGIAFLVLRRNHMNNAKKEN